MIFRIATNPCFFAIEFENFSEVFRSEKDLSNEFFLSNPFNFGMFQARRSLLSPKEKVSLRPVYFRTTIGIIQYKTLSQYDNCYDMVCLKV